MIIHITLKFRDTGIGISKEQLTKIFDRFYQVNSAHTREHGGTGIGLSLAKELVELIMDQFQLIANWVSGQNLK